MKLLRSLPTDKGFFDIYALLIRVIIKSKTAAQVVSGLTEIGIIYAVTYQAIHPLLPQYAIYIAAIIAAIFTIVIEGGLRVVTPLSVDAILFKRYQGLHLPMTIAIFTVTTVLLIVSGLLSFQNSGEIVEAVIPETKNETTIKIDSNHQAESARIEAIFSVDSSMIANRYKNLIAAAEQVHQSRIAATQRKLQNYINKEARTGNSYASRKDNERTNIAQLKANESEALATLENAKSNELATARSELKANLITEKRKHEKDKNVVIDTNEQAKVQRQNKVNSYGGKLGYFTLVCLFIFITANVLDRIHQKGSGIQETIDLSQYDVSPHWLTNAKEALTERIKYFFQSRIKAFADATPPAPLPEQKTELYDPTQVANVTITLKLGQDNGQNHNIIYIEPKRRKIGFQQTFTKNNLNQKSVQAQQNKCAIKDTSKGTYETPDLRQLKQRLKMYKKRLGGHEQKKLLAERKGEKVSKKTLSAIENNQEWVVHYEQLINDITVD